MNESRSFWRHPSFSELVTSSVAEDTSSSIEDAHILYDDVDLLDYCGLSKEEMDRITKEVEESTVISDWLSIDKKRVTKTANNDNDYKNNGRMKLNDIIDDIQDFIKRNPEEKSARLLADFVPKLKGSLENKEFEKSAPTLPDKAPVLWTGNHFDDDTPATFIMRHYSEYMGKGLTTGTIRKLDPTLASTYSAWKNPKKGPAPEMPPGFNLPSKRQVIDERDSVLTPEAAADASRTSSRAYRKNQRANSQAQGR